MGRDHSEELGADGNIGMDPRKIEWEGVDCIHPAYSRDQWQSLVNTVMNFRIP
jgi:hypothetical protein